jgi:hypothetical protein
MEIQKLEVGQLLNEGETKFAESIKFDFQQSGPVMIIFFERPTDKEIESIRAGKLEFAFYEKDEIIFILSKFQGIEWMDAPYTVHLSKPFEFQEMQEGLGFGLQIILVDAATGIIKAMRYVGLSTQFSIKLKKAIEAQREQPWDLHRYDVRLQNIYNNYSTSDLAKRAGNFCKIK